MNIVMDEDMSMDVASPELSRMSSKKRQRQSMIFGEHADSVASAVICGENGDNMHSLQNNNGNHPVLEGSSNLFYPSSDENVFKRMKIEDDSMEGSSLLNDDCNNPTVIEREESSTFLGQGIGNSDQALECGAMVREKALSTTFASSSYAAENPHEHDYSSFNQMLGGLHFARERRRRHTNQQHYVYLNGHKYLYGSRQKGQG